MSDYSDFSRDELEAYCRDLESLTDDAHALFQKYEKLWRYLKEVTETDSGNGSKETLRWRVKVLKRRNEKLKEENSELEARAENAERKAEAVKGVEVIERMHVLQLLGECQRKLKQARAQNAKRIQEPKASDAERIAEAVFQASKAGEHWNSGNDLLEWLHQWAEEYAPPSMPHSKSTLKRRLQEAGLWAGSGRSGKASVADTVERCIAFHRERK